MEQYRIYYLFVSEDFDNFEKFILKHESLSKSIFYLKNVEQLVVFLTNLKGMENCKLLLIRDENLSDDNEYFSKYWHNMDEMDEKFTEDIDKSTFNYLIIKNGEIISKEDTMDISTLIPIIPQLIGLIKEIYKNKNISNKEISEFEKMKANYNKSIRLPNSKEIEKYFNEVKIMELERHFKDFKGVSIKKDEVQKNYDSANKAGKLQLLGDLKFQLYELEKEERELKDKILNDLEELGLL